jgi:HSP20 family protein
MGDLDAGRVAADGATWLVHEIAAGEYIRQITLPRAVDADKARTTFDNGVLTLTLPKSEDAKPRKSTRPGEGSVDRTTC